MPARQGSQRGSVRPGRDEMRSGTPRNSSRKIHGFLPKHCPHRMRRMQAEKRREFAVFFFLTFILAPILAVLIVAGYGFAVWMYQLIAGPPSV